MEIDNNFYTIHKSQNKEKQTVYWYSESLRALIEGDDYYPYLKFYEQVLEILYGRNSG